MRATCIIKLFCFGACVAGVGSDTTGEAYTSLLGFALENTTVAEIKLTLGEAEMHDSGDASTSSHRINYFLERENCYVTFDTGEMGGRKYPILCTVSGSSPDESYTSNKHASFAPQDFGGLRLGMPQDVCRSMFGERAKLSGDTLHATFHRKRPMTDAEMTKFAAQDIDIAGDEFFDVTIGVSAWFANGKIEKFSVFKATTW